MHPEPLTSRSRRRFGALALAALAAFTTACSTSPATTPNAHAATASPAAAPRLVVFIAIDGLPMRQVTGYRDQFAPDGFRRFLDRGTWFADAHQGHAHTVTAAGHAAMLTGAYPQRTGIISNDWRDIDTGARIYNTGDSSAQYIGNRTGALDGTSPKNLKVKTVGDMLREARPGAKVIAISGKDRGAILPAGQTGTAYMYMSQSGQFASSTFYMPAHPAWVDRFNNAKPADRYFKAQWLPALDDAAYARSMSEEQPWFGMRGGRLPMTLGASDETPGAVFYANLLRSPFVDQLSLDFARAAVAGEGLGQDDVTDILSISLSGHDYVNHAWSAESRMSHDHLLHVDRMLQDFFAHLDRTVGRERYLAVLTADHGFTMPPELARLRGLDGGRAISSEVLGRVNAALEQKFGVPKLAAFFSASALVLDRKLLATHKLDLDTVAEAARSALMTEPVYSAAYTRRELQQQSRRGAPFFDQMLLAWNAERSGDVQTAIKPYWLFSSAGAQHGTPHRDDTHVPILFWGPAWLGSGQVDQRVEVVDIAPTLARLLQVSAPPTAQGKPLPLTAPAPTSAR